MDGREGVTGCQYANDGRQPPYATKEEWGAENNVSMTECGNMMAGMRGVEEGDEVLWAYGVRYWRGVERREKARTENGAQQPATQLIQTLAPPSEPKCCACMVCSSSVAKNLSGFRSSSKLSRSYSQRSPRDRPSVKLTICPASPLIQIREHRTC